MSFNGHTVEQEEYRVVLVLPWSQRVLAENHGHTRRLPRISIAKWARAAEQLSESLSLQMKWAERSIVIDLLAGSKEVPPCAVVEVRARAWNFSLVGFIAVNVDALDHQELTIAERLTVKSIVAGETQDRGPFSKLGWIEEAKAWIRESVADRQVNFSDDVRQFSAGGRFALARFGTANGPAYWLKATSAPNTHEFTIIKTLARICSLFLPPLIAARKDWNAWVSEETGQPLNENVSLHAFQQATRCLAEMQVTSADHVEKLLACGCFGQQLPVLREHLPQLMHYLEVAMTRQTSTKALPINRKRLSELGLLLQEASAAMEAIGIPETLIHNDMNLGNILFDGVRAVFTDWSEACIGTPFFTFQHLQVQAMEVDETHTWAPQLKEIYVDPWRRFLSESQIEKAFALSPPLAIASYLLGRDPSFTSSHRDNDSVQSYARSLARHMDRFAQAPEFLEAL